MYRVRTGALYSLLCTVPYVDAVSSGAPGGWQRINASEYQRLVAEHKHGPPKDELASDHLGANAEKRQDEPLTGDRGKPLRRSNGDDNEPAFRPEHQRLRPKRTPRPKLAIPTAPPRPRANFSKDVIWLMDDNTFGLRPADDQSLKIRMGPPPASGSPWPMPRVYQPMALVYQLKSAEFHMHALGFTCDVLETAFERAHKNAFVASVPANAGEVFYSDGRTAVPLIYYLNVTVAKRCNKYPSLHMVESCEYPSFIMVESCEYPSFIMVESCEYYSFIMVESCEYYSFIMVESCEYRCLDIAK